MVKKKSTAQRLKETRELVLQQAEHGEPDNIDKKNISNLIAAYETTYPYPHNESIGRSLELGLMETSRSAGIIKKKGMTRRLSMPKRFMTALKMGYPYIIKNDAQFAWFLKNFPMFDLLNPDNEKLKKQFMKGKTNGNTAHRRTSDDSKK